MTKKGLYWQKKDLIRSIYHSRFQVKNVQGRVWLICFRLEKMVCIFDKSSCPFLRYLSNFLKISDELRTHAEVYIYDFFVFMVWRVYLWSILCLWFIFWLVITFTRPFVRFLYERNLRIKTRLLKLMKYMKIQPPLIWNKNRHTVWVLLSHLDT